MENIAGQASDDIFALFSRFDLDTTNYRIFERVMPHVETAAVSGSIVASASPAALKQEDPIPVRRELRPQAPAPSPAVSPRYGIDDVPALLHRASRAVQNSERRARGNGIATCVQVFGAAGGVGVTTVIATLARLIARQGHRCGLYGGPKETVLALHFGVQRLTRSKTSFPGLRSLYEPSVHILPAGSLSPDSELTSLPERELVRAVSADCGHQLDYLLCDRSAETAAPEGCRVYVAVPDVGSVFGIQRFLEHESHREHPEETICVLNRYNAESPLHVEIRSWFTEHFNTVISIPESRLIPESLADASTVVDLCPESSVSLEFERLGEVLSALAAKRSTRKQEGDLLCS